MKRLFSIIKILTILSFIATPIFATSVPKDKPTFNKVYRTSKIADSYYFLLLTNDGKYYYIRTNKTKSLTANEIKSSSILKILNKKQSWGEAFASKGRYTIKHGKLYTVKVVDRIEASSPKKIKYLNKTFYLQ